MKIDKHKLLQEYTIREILESGLIEYLGCQKGQHRFRCRLCDKRVANYKVLKFSQYRWIVYHMSRVHPTYYYMLRRRAILRLLEKTTLGESHLDGKLDLKILKDLKREGKIALVKIKKGTVVLLK